MAGVTVRVAQRRSCFPTPLELQGLVASSPDNLRNAIDAESQEVEKFTEFARQATEDREEFYRGISSGGLE
jgi:hypothetical protein